MKSRKRPVTAVYKRTGYKVSKPAFEYQLLEPRQLLAGLLNSPVATGVAGPTSLYYEMNEPVSLDSRMEVLRAHLQLRQNEQLRLIDLERDQLGYVNFKYQQYFNRVPVENGIYRVHARDGQITGLSGDYQRIGNVSTSAILTESEALDVALDFVDAEIYAWESGSGLINEPASIGEDSFSYVEDFEIPTGQLTIVDDTEGESRLAFKFDVFAIEPLSREYIFVDAIEGDIVRVKDRINTFDVPATGTSLYNGTVDFTADDNGAFFRLRQSAQGVETFTLNGSTTYGNATDITSVSSSFTAPAVWTGVQAHYGVEQSLDFFQQSFGRNSFDNNGALVQSFVSYGNGVNNAFWNGSTLTFGDGDGFILNPLVSLDIVGHEFAHGVMQNTANLDNFLEPGALNESFSDIFGESIEDFATGSTDWLVGEQPRIGSGLALRSMSDPKAFGDPDTYLGENWYVGGEDNGGIHTNLGVQNKWFYLVAEGGSGTNDGNVSYDIEGIGIQDAAAIVYRSLTLYLTPNTQYADARVGAIQAAVDLFGPGSAQQITTEAAWDAVGVYDPNVEVIPAAVDNGTPGSLIYNVRRVEAFDLGFSDTYVVPLDAAQNLTVVVEGQISVVPTIEVFDPTGALIANDTGTGNLAVLQSLPVNAEGFYFVVVGGANNTFGGYTLDIYLNADIEFEYRGGADNGDMNSAQSLESSSLAFSTPTLARNFDRLAVVGSLTGELPTGTVVYSDSFESGSLGAAWTSSSTGNGRISVTNAYGASTGSYALVMDTASGYALNEAILSFDVSSMIHPVLKISYAEWGDETHSLPSTFTGSFDGDGIAISDDGTNWYTILTGMTSDPGEWIDVNLDLLDAAAAAGIALDANFQVKLQQYDNFSLPNDGRAFDAIEIVETEAPADWYTFDIASGQIATAFVSSIDASTSVQLDLFDELGLLLFSGTNSGELDSLIGSIVGDGGTYFAQITGDGEYNLVVTRGAAFDIEPNDFVPQDISGVAAVFGNTISLGIAGAEPDDAPFGTILDNWYTAVTLSNNVTGGSVYSYDGSYFGAPTGNAVFARDPEALGFFWRQGADELRADFSIPQQTVSIDVGADDNAGDVAWLRAFDTGGFLIGEVYSGRVAYGQSETLTIDRPVSDIAYIVSAGIDGEVVPLDNLVFDISLFDEDLYSVDVSAGDRLNFTAYIPGAGPNLFQNRLVDADGSHLFMELIDPSGNSIGGDNWNIDQLASVSGTYSIRVFADESAGEYILMSDVVTGINEPTGIDFGPVGSAVYQDYAAVSDEAYDPILGYGWLDANGLFTYSGRRGNDLIRDRAILRNGTFAIDVDNGNYEVVVVLGIIGRSDPVEITVEGQTDLFTPSLGPNVRRTFVVDVTDGQLTIDLDASPGLDNRMGISGIKLNEIQGRGFNGGDEPNDNRSKDDFRFTRFTELVRTAVVESRKEDSSLIWSGKMLNMPPVAVGLSGSFEFAPRIEQQTWKPETRSTVVQRVVPLDVNELNDISEDVLFET